MAKLVYTEFSSKIFDLAMRVHDQLGLGFTEKVSRIIFATHRAHALNYLKATNLKPGFIINFGAPKRES